MVYHHRKLSAKRHAFSGFRRRKTPQELERVSEAYYYDMIISSGELKKLILRRIKELDVDMNLFSYWRHEKS